MKAKIIYLFLITVIIEINITCNSVEPPPPPNGEKPTLTLKLEDVSCTEAWIKLETTSLQLPADVTLLQDGETRKTINVETKDTLLYIDSLLPNKTYNFHTTIQSSNYTSNELSVTTMDTTSHNFTWQVFKLGEHQHSILRDVAVIGDEIWAVGEIYMNDSLGNPDPQPYAAVHWDGTEWRLLKVPYHDFNQTTKYPGPLFTIDVISDEIYVVSYANLLKWTGSGWEEKAFFMKQIPFDGQVLKMFGNNGNNIYCVGRNGAIYNYFGSGWQKVESGTEVNLYDVWGDNDGTIWTCGYSDDYGTTALLRYTGEQWETVYEGNSSSQNNGFYIGPISGVWSCNKYRIYLMNWNGVYLQSNSNELFLEKEIAKFDWVSYGIDGTDDNNIFVCGQKFVGHWNGMSYNEYDELWNDQRRYYGVSVKGNIVCAVGSDYNGPIYSQAVIALSK